LQGANGDIPANPDAIAHALARTPQKHLPTIGNKCPIAKKLAPLGLRRCDTQVVANTIARSELNVFRDLQAIPRHPSTGKGQWRWRLRAGNHETVASGESYVNKADCLHVIELIKGVQSDTPVKEI
jgi:uncharacterized protein YegP (UPF0339 family)